MASSKVRPTPPPRGPALVRPAVGALLLTLSGAACGDDDGTGDTANDTQPPMSAGSEGPMPNPTTDDTLPPMTTATSGTSDSGDDSNTAPMPPPMPDPSETADSGSTGTGTGTDSGSGSGGTTDIPPMPPPTGGVLPGDEPE